MQRISRITAGRLFIAGLFAVVCSASLWAQISVRSVKVLGANDTVEVEVEASDRVVPQTQVLSGPDRLVVDFPNAVPVGQLHSQSIDRGEVKDVRVALFRAKPPVTRLVLDLKSAQSYQVFPYGRTVMIKVVGSGSDVHVPQSMEPQATQPGLVSVNYTARAEPEQRQASPQPPLQVSYQNGLLAISANRATLSQVLFAIQQRTGAEIAIPAGAEQEQVAANIEPAPAPEVLARLLNGSKFNFLILSAPNDPQKLDKVILSMRYDGVFTTPPAVRAQNVPAANDDSSDDNSSFAGNQPSNGPPSAPQAPQQPEQGPPASDNSQPQ